MGFFLIFIYVLKEMHYEIIVVSDQLSQYAFGKGFHKRVYQVNINVLSLGAVSENIYLYRNNVVLSMSSSLNKETMYTRT